MISALGSAIRYQQSVLSENLLALYASSDS